MTTAPQSKGPRWGIVVAVVAVIGMIGIYFLYQQQRDPERAAREKAGVLEPEMVRVPAGVFLMGASNKDSDASVNEFPQHRVVHQKPFMIGKYEVTFNEYDGFALATGRGLPDDRGWGRGKRPVINVSWRDAKEYVDWLSTKTGVSYRLPTEAEWEYAAKAGTQTRYWWGDDIGKNRANCYGCRSKWDLRQTAPVGSFKSNEFGLYDTAGNVFEWVEDCWHNSYEGAPVDGSSVWAGVQCAQRVIRGGSWRSGPWDIRSTLRYGNSPGYRRFNLGFRLARDIE